MIRQETSTFNRNLPKTTHEKASELEKFQNVRDKANSAVYNSPKMLSATESAEDDYLTKRANNTIKGVNNGTESIEDATKDADEVLKHRRTPLQKTSADKT